MQTLVFDLDGTLVDTAPDLIDTLNFTLVRYDLPAVRFDAARPLIGGGARGMIERALAAEGRDCSPAGVDELYAAFVAHYAEHIADRSRPFPGVEPVLDRLAAAGHRLAVCTNKLEWLATRLLEELGLSRHFAAICGQDTFGGDPKHAIMIGDSPTDVNTARAAAVPIVAVDFGYTDVPIASLEPDRVISSFAQLPAAITDLGFVNNALDSQGFIGLER